MAKINGELSTLTTKLYAEEERLVEDKMYKTALNEELAKNFSRDYTVSEEVLEYLIVQNTGGYESLRGVFLKVMARALMNDQTDIDLPFVISIVSELSEEK